MSSGSRRTGPDPGSAIVVHSSHETELWERIAQLEATVRRQEKEAQELQEVISTKDQVIRTLGAQLEAASTASHVVQAKDVIIRELGLELSALAEGSGGAKDPAGARLGRSSCALGPDAAPHRTGAPPAQRGAVDPTPLFAELWEEEAAGASLAIPFTVLPVHEGEVYMPAEESTVDRRIAAFSNARHCKVLFTRIDRYDNYLFGRIVVHCSVDDSCGHGVGVHVRESDERLPLGDFVERYEDARSKTDDLGRHWRDCRATRVIEGQYML